MDDKEFEITLLDFLKQRAKGKKVPDIINEYLSRLNTTQVELVMMHDYLFRCYPKELWEAITDKNENSKEFFSTFAEGWMVRAKLHSELFIKNNLGVGVPVSQN